MPWISEILSAPQSCRRVNSLTIDAPRPKYNSAMCKNAIIAIVKIMTQDEEYYNYNAMFLAVDVNAECLNPGYSENKLKKSILGYRMHNVIFVIWNELTRQPE